jgi:hypothetical protein
LSNDNKPKIKSTIKVNPTINISFSEVFIPIEQEIVQFDSSVVFQKGQISNNQIIGIWNNNKASGTISLSNPIQITTEENSSKYFPQLYNDEKMDRAYIFLQSGLERIFLYNYANEKEKSTAIQNYIGAFDLYRINKLQVVLPLNAERKEIRDGSVELPPKIGKIGDYWEYPAVFEEAKRNNLCIKYMIPANAIQIFTVEALVKIIILLIPISINFIIVRSKKKPKRDIIIGIIFFIITVAVYLLIIRINISTVKESIKITFDIISGVGAAIISVLINIRRKRIDQQ